MTDWLDTVARLQAYHKQKATPIASHCRVSLQPHAFAFCPLLLAGHDCTIHMIALGPLCEQAPQILWIPDPCMWQDQYALFERVTDILERYVQMCVMQQMFPQLWVPSQDAVDLIEILADRLRFQSQYPKVQRLGELLTYFSQRVDVTGQQSLMITPRVLCTHWRTGQDEAEDTHLASVLTWIDPPSNSSFFDALAIAEHLPSSVRTSAAFDRRTLAPLLRRYRATRKKHQTGQEEQDEACPIYDALYPISSELYRQVRHAYTFLASAGLPFLPSLPRFEKREYHEFHAYLQCLSKGIHFPLQDSFRAAIYGLIMREDAAELMEAVLWVEDRVERARGYLSGHILAGIVIGYTVTSRNGRTVLSSFHLCSHQATYSAKLRDEWIWIDAMQMKGTITAIQQGQQGERYLTLALHIGTKLTPQPPIGKKLEFIRHKPDWHRLWCERTRLSRRLFANPWVPFAPTPSADTPSYAVDTDGKRI